MRKYEEAIGEHHHEEKEGVEQFHLLLRPVSKMVCKWNYVSPKMVLKN
jgi:hypothetical protein